MRAYSKTCDRYKVSRYIRWEKYGQRPIRWKNDIYYSSTGMRLKAVSEYDDFGHKHPIIIDAVTRSTKACELGQHYR